MPLCRTDEAALAYTLNSKNGQRVYVSNSGAGTISEIDTGDWTVKRQLEAGPGPEHMTFSLDGNRIYVVNPGAGKVSEVVVDSGKIVRSFETGSGVHAIDLESGEGHQATITTD